MNIIKNLRKYVDSAGIDVSFLLNSVMGLPDYIKNYRIFKKLASSHTNIFAWGAIYPCPADRKEQSGVASGPYFHQDLLVASRVFRNNPVRHVDIGSRVDGFVAHVASFREIEVFDIRSLSSNIPNIRFVQADIMSASFSLDGYCDSVSSLHAIEHFGLGRYGDPLDFFGYKKGLDNIYRILKPGGRFYFSVPIGPQRIEFDAHRVFSVEYLLNIFKDIYRLDSFSFVDDAGNLHADVEISGNEAARNFGCSYGCGIFELTKL